MGKSSHHMGDSVKTGNGLLRLERRLALGELRNRWIRLLPVSEHLCSKKGSGAETLTIGTQVCLY